jgi:hypothetical protein
MPLFPEPTVIAPSFQIDPIDTLLAITTPSAPTGATLPVEVIDRLAPDAIVCDTVLAEVIVVVCAMAGATAFSTMTDAPARSTRWKAAELQMRAGIIMSTRSYGLGRKCAELGCFPQRARSGVAHQIGFGAPTRWRP